MPPANEGREHDHIVAIDAALRAGVRHVYYTSLAFGNPSKAAVQRAHVRTEAYLAEKLGSGAAGAVVAGGDDTKTQAKAAYTVLREGLYSESWPLYFGMYHNLWHDTRRHVVIAGDGPISWTAIADLGLASALVLAAPAERYAGKTFYLAAAGNEAKTITDIAEMVSRARGRRVDAKIVSVEEYVEWLTAGSGCAAGRVVVEHVPGARGRGVSDRGYDT